MSKGIICLEVNEVPPFVWSDFVNSYKSSTLAQLLQQDTAVSVTTVVSDVKEDFLYPSQTWAGFYSGKPFDEHKIHWYSDEKPAGIFFWEQLSKLGYTVGLVNAPHSSPGANLDNPNFAYLIPDCFARDPFTKPREYVPFQTINLEATAEAGRSVSVARLLSKSALPALLKPSTFGVSPHTIAELLTCLHGYYFRGKSKETLRDIQFPILAKIFLDLQNEHAPQYASIFTNHVAANMHRFWYAAYPEHFSNKLYPDTWIRKNKNNIRDSLKSFDRFLRKVIAVAVKQEKVVLISTSMGQQPNLGLSPVTTQRTHDIRLDDPLKFLAALGMQTENLELGKNMIPQYSFIFGTPQIARAFAVELKSRLLPLSFLNKKIDQQDRTITVTVWLSDNIIEITNNRQLYVDLGFSILPIDNHHSGMHHPRGSIMVFNDRSNWFKRKLTDEMSYLFAQSVITEYLQNQVKPAGRRLSI